jgi:hypothetical protein
MAFRSLVLVLVGTSVLAFASITALSIAGGYPPLPKNALFQAVTPRNIDQVRNRINGSSNDDERNQIRVGTVLVYKTSAGNVGKMQIVKYGSRLHMDNYDLYVKFVTYTPDGSILLQRRNFLIKGTWLYDLDTGKAINTQENRASDLWWEIVGAGHIYLDFKNGASFTIVS